MATLEQPAITGKVDLCCFQVADGHGYVCPQVSALNEKPRLTNMRKGLILCFMLVTLCKKSGNAKSLRDATLCL